MSYESQEKCSSLAQPRSKFYKTRLMSIFTSKKVLKNFDKKLADKPQGDKSTLLVSSKVKKDY